jgi:hypothetical protein
MAQIDPNNPYQGEIVGLDRQRKLADMLLKQGMAQNNMEGQMVSGRYVGASPWQGIANLANIYVAKSLGEEADTKQQAIAEKLRNLGKEEVANITDTALGREARKEIMAGPYDVSQGIQQPTIDYAAMKADPRAALAMAGSAQTPEGRAFAPRLLDVAMPRPSELKQNYQDWLASGGKGTMMDYQREVANLKREPVSYSTVETPQGVYTFNNRTGQLTPAVDATGKPIMGKGNALTEAQGKATTFQGTMMNAAKNMKELEDKGYNPASFKNQAQFSSPSITNVAIPAQSQQYKQAMDNFANAYLRFQSGANMSEQEIQRNLREMMPVFGDKPENLKQKADARENAIRFMSYSAGPGAQMLAQANANMPPANPVVPATPAAPAAPKGPLTFGSEADAAKARLPNGTKVIINGVSGTWTN